MKTAMQELIERLERNIKEMPNEVNTFTQGYKAGLNFVIECATTSLEKEKEQNNQIVRDVFEHCWNHPNWEGEYDIKDMNDYLERLNK